MPNLPFLPLMTGRPVLDADPAALAVIDPAVPHADRLVEGAAPDIGIARPSVGMGDAVAAALADAGTPVETLHLVSHGAPGRLTLGGRSLDARALAERGRRWRRHLAPGATIVLYGCSAGRGDAGRTLVRKLARATGARVLASSTPTGATDRGGDWRFDVASSGTSSSAASAFARAHDTWPGLLANVSNTNDSGAGSFRSVATTSNSMNVTLTGTQTVTLNSGPVVVPSSASALWDFNSVDITFEGDGIVFNNSNAISMYGNDGILNITFNNNLSGAGDLTFGSAGTGNDQTVTLGGTNSLTGTIRVAAGDTLSIASDANLGDATVRLDRATLTVTGATTIHNAVQLNHADSAINTAADVTLSGTLSSTGNLTKTGASTLTLSGTNTFSGTTTVSSGTLSVSADNNLGSGAVTLNGGNLTVTGATTIDNAVALSSNATVTNSADVTLSGVVSGANNLTKAGASTLTLSGTNTYSGTTTVTGGTLSVSADGNLGTGAVTLNGGNLTVTGATTIDNSIALSSNATVSSSANATVSGVISGTNNLTKSGTGTLTLSGTNTYSGTTTVDGGTLAVDGSLTASTVTVSSGGTLGGSGSISGAVTISSGGTLAPGNSPGTLATGNLTLSSGSKGSFEINGTTAGTNHDQIDVTGSVDLTGATLSTSFGFTSATGDVFTLIANDGADAITGTFSGLAEGATFNANGRIYKISYVGDTGNDLTLTDTGAVPASATITEPIVGTEADERLMGGSFMDTISGLSGDDTLSGRIGDDLIYGDGGNDLLYGNRDNDTLWGGGGNDTVYAGQDDDLLYGNRDADRLCGNRGSDTLYGGQGDDILYGNQEDDLLLGNLGGDTLYGGQGNDTLSGGAGDDELRGNDGADSFVFSFGDGNDTVADYDRTEGDVLRFEAGTGVTSASTDAGLLLTAGDTTVTLTGVTALADVDIVFQ
ncbi:DUF4347 domain-containing protein [Nisaea acidiphila]|uniref:DUF4347 domain-containing protein n=1 Tax=Nisaea acidiphila TaxID=1862145 RepID=A0A9J7AUY1_9PROT|nr:DUF4347 domain-containing protein [Nisaea acidiphila]UUX51135.1 DUF4347 domain-containing protein [Nisaea acidiphila]